MQEKTTTIITYNAIFFECIAFLSNELTSSLDPDAVFLDFMLDSDLCKKVEWLGYVTFFPPLAKSSSWW